MPLSTFRFLHSLLHSMKVSRYLLSHFSTTCLWAGPSLMAIVQFGGDSVAWASPAFPPLAYCYPLTDISSHLIYLHVERAPAAKPEASMG